MTAYYNEIDGHAAAWLRNLIADGQIAPGHVDERSIRDVQPRDLDGYTQCHFFAGIGVWSYALRQAGWRDDAPVWTGSCPCQPFSVAGRREAFEDERHLWPEFFRLIAARRPIVVLGEQTSGKDGYAWLDLVHADLAQEDYTCRAVDIPAGGFGAPHRRNRIYWVADANMHGREPLAEYRLRIQEHYAQSRGRDLVVGHAGRFGGGRHAGAIPGPQGGSRFERLEARHLPDFSVAAIASDGVVDAAHGGRGEFGRALVARPSGHAHGADPAFQLVADADPGRSSSGDGGKGLGDSRQSERPGRFGRVADAALLGHGRRDVAGGAGGAAGASAPSIGGRPTGRFEPSGAGAARGVADAHGARRQRFADGNGALQPQLPAAERNGQDAGELVDTAGRRRTRFGSEPELHEPGPPSSRFDGPGPVNGRWAAADWIFCRDAKWRPVEPGLEPLVDRAPRGVGPSRTGRLKGYGGAIVAPQATAFIEAYLETRFERLP